MTDSVSFAIALPLDDDIVPLSAVRVIETRIASGNDDVEERHSGRMSFDSTDLELSTDKNIVQTIGLRFTNLDIPAGAVVTRAYIQFETDEVGSTDTFLEVRGLATDDTAAFTSNRYDLSSREMTGAVAGWAPEPWTVVHEAAENQRTSDLSEIVQEIVSRPGWQEGNDLGFSITGSGRRTAEAYDGNSARAPVLHVEYYVPEPPPPPPGGELDIVFAEDPSFRENVAGAIIGTLGIAAPVLGQNYVFSISDERFQLVGNVLKLDDGLRLDFERTPSISVQVTATGSTGATVTETITATLGDVAETRFAAFGDYGNRDGADSVAKLVDALNPDFIITTGDNVYGSTLIDAQIGNKYSEYIGNYDGAYGPGSATNRFFPSLGNHEYNGEGGGVDDYLDYFTLPGNERYYDFVMGPVHFFALNSNPEEPDGRSSTSDQADWLKDELAASSSLYNIVFFHHPPFNSGNDHGSTEEMQWPFEEWGATAVLSGHEHVYERLLRDDDGDGNLLPYFITGLGGASRYAFGSPVEGSQVRYNDDYGTMLIQASDESITFEFWSVEGGGTGTLIDSFTIDVPAAAPSALAAAVEPIATADLMNPVVDPLATFYVGQSDYWI